MKSRCKHLLYPVLFIFAALAGIIQFCGCGSEFGILLDKPNGPATIYWAEPGAGIIRRVYSDSTEPELLITCSGTPLDIALDSLGRRVFWTEFSGTSYQIRKASIDGTGDELFYEYPSSPNHGPTAITIDPIYGKLFGNRYQNSSGHHDIWRSDLDTASEEKWCNTLPLSYTFAMCTDPENRYLYITANTYWDINTIFGSGNSGAIYRADLDTLNTYSEVLTGTASADPSCAFRDIAVDSTGGHVFYVEPSEGLTIMRAGPDLGGPVEWIDPGGGEIRYLAIDPERRKIYWADAGNNIIYRADLDAHNSGINEFLQITGALAGLSIDP